MNKTKSKQTGFVLGVSLIILLVATMIVLTSMQGSTMQERMSSNHNNKLKSQIIAETGASIFIDNIIAQGNEKWDKSDLKEWYLNSHFKEPTLLVEDGDGYYFFNDVTFSESGVSFISVGKVVSGEQILGNSSFYIEYTREGGGGFDAPATISCIGGPCEITAGAGGGADVGFGMISGYDHPAYDPTCGNSAECRRLKPIDSSDANLLARVPALYFSDTSSIATMQGGGHDKPYHGLSRPPSETNVSGQNGDNVAWHPEHYPPVDGVDTVPTIESLFGSSGPVQDLDNGLLIIDGIDDDLGGNDIFNGLIVIKNCGTLSMSGNPNIYGAIVIDATGCPSEAYIEEHCKGKGKGKTECKYDPFGGKGTPAVRYSSEALRNITGGGNVQGSKQIISKWVEKFSDN